MASAPSPSCGAPCCGGGVGLRRGLRVGWWNVRALLAERRQERAAKAAELRALCSQMGVLIVCEIRGNAYRVAHGFRILRQQIGWRLSCIGEAVAGGMLAMMRRDVAEGAEVRFSEILHGRVMGTCGRGEVYRSRLSEPITSERRSSDRWRERVQERREAAFAEPPHGYVAVAGDWIVLTHPGTGSTTRGSWGRCGPRRRARPRRAAGRLRTGPRDG